MFNERYGFRLGEFKNTTGTERVNFNNYASDDETITQIFSFNYLGATAITADGRSKKEIRTRSRIGMTKDAFNKMGEIFTDRKPSLNIKLRLIKTFV